MVTVRACGQTGLKGLPRLLVAWSSARPVRHTGKLSEPADLAVSGFPIRVSAGGCTHLRTCVRVTTQLKNLIVRTGKGNADMTEFYVRYFSLYDW